MQEALVLFIAYLNQVVSSTCSSEPLVKDNIDICLPNTANIIAQKFNAKNSAIIYTYHCYWFNKFLHQEYVFLFCTISICDFKICRQ